MLDVAEYSSSAECVGSRRLNTITKKKKSKNKPRFSDEQIRSLEVTFESETKLEPNKKVQLARELGLQPRQVAIWFQNKRARCKSKHVEREYSMLLADYNSLASQFENLMKEKQSLLSQLQKLKNEAVGKSEERKTERSIREREAGNDGEFVNCKFDLEVKNEVLKMGEPGAADSSLTSVEDWGSLDNSNDMMNQASDESFLWWDFWA